MKVSVISFLKDYLMVEEYIHEEYSFVLKSWSETWFGDRFGFLGLRDWAMLADISDALQPTSSILTSFRVRRNTL